MQTQILDIMPNKKYEKMLVKTKYNNAYWLFISVAVLVLDQLSKYWILAYLMARGADKKITSWFDLRLVYNDGAAFSFLQGAGGWQHWFFLVIACVITVYLLQLLHAVKSTDSMRLPLAISLILGGAWGNVIDRLRLGHVIDFIHWHIGNWSWPVFNIADSAICVGAVILVITLVKNEVCNENI